MVYVVCRYRKGQELDQLALLLRLIEGGAQERQGLHWQLAHALISHRMVPTRNTARIVINSIDEACTTT